MCVICTSETHGFCGTSHLSRLHGSCLFRLGRKRYPAEGDTAWRCSSSYPLVNTQKTMENHHF